MGSLFVGLMSGTSMDGVDAALADLSHAPPRLLQTHTHDFPKELRDPLGELATGHDLPLDTLGVLDARVGTLFADATLALLHEAGVEPSRVEAIGSHGQTVRHRPGAQPAFTLQIGDPNIIAQRTGILTVADFRRRDVAAGGQGAPLATGFHVHALHSGDEDRVVVNLGGIANITRLPATGAVTGFDTGPANTLVDAWIRNQLGARFDENGDWARRGRVDASLLERLLADPFFSAPPPKSTGTEYFNLQWLRPRLSGTEKPEDVQATLTRLTARSVAAAICSGHPPVSRVLACGGGVRNAYLMEELARELGDVPLQPTSAAGVDPDWVEALAFAWLARQRLRGEAGNVPSVTGARAAVPLGGVYGAAL